ncbi:hypothetical protein FRB90_002421 [Tulasnella sp. 427]|nr:hypothetical protein FRB90_002421 [Tulasnella sp. 427]
MQTPQGPQDLYAKLEAEISPTGKMNGSVEDPATRSAMQKSVESTETLTEAPGKANDAEGPVRKRSRKKKAARRKAIHDREQKSPLLIKLPIELLS